VDNGSLQIFFLGSGSSGNSTVVRSGATTVLLDCGFGVGELGRRLQGAGVDPADIDAVLVTHEHRDHVAGLPLFSRCAGLPVYLTGRTRSAVRFGARALTRPVQVEPGRTFSVGRMEILPFVTAHDAGEPAGYVFRFEDGRRFGVATDLGHANPEAVAALEGCDLIGLEANHDPDMLADGPYPWYLKKRISGDSGHLSNPAAADLLERIVSSRLTHLFAMHLSQTNNRPALAVGALSSRLAQLGLKVPVTAVAQNGLLRYPKNRQMKLF